jgi:hypothetical protein
MSVPRQDHVKSPLVQFREVHQLERIQMVLTRCILVEATLAKHGH